MVLGTRRRATALNQETGSKSVKTSGSSNKLLLIRQWLQVSLEERSAIQRRDVEIFCQNGVRRREYHAQPTGKAPDAGL